MLRVVQAPSSIPVSGPPSPVQGAIRPSTVVSLRGRDRFLAACACQPLDRPPLWLMRQAGRALPEYRELKQKFSFLELVQTPALASEVTLQPIRRFGFDAAIIFSDILVVAEALGQRYEFREGGGIRMQWTIESAHQVERLDLGAVTDHLQYVADALRLTRSALDGETALLGFAGSPWTLANFMLEGGSSAEFTKAKALFRENPRLYGRLAEKLTRAVADYLMLQFEAGADAVQLFDTLGGEADEADFDEVSARWLRDIVAELGGRGPVIVFAKGVNNRWPLLAQTGATVLGADWTVPLRHAADQLPSRVAVQGNLDPALLRGDPAPVRAAAQAILESMRGRPGHIFNLGHGVPPEARLDSIQALVETVKGHR